MRITRRIEASTVADWRQAPTVVKTRARLAELDAFIATAQDRLHRHDALVTDEARALERAEVEVLAGRSTDAALATAQARHIAARRERAKHVIAVEDAEAERAKLQAALPSIEHQAKQASYDAIRAKGAALLKEMRAALTAMAQAEGDFQALVSDAESQFPQGMHDPKSPAYDPPFGTRAGLFPLTETRMNGYRQEVVDLEGATGRFAQEIDAQLAALTGEREIKR